MFPWAQFFLYVLVTAGTPGPNTLSSMSNGSRLGFRRTLPYIFGIWAGFSIVSTASSASFSSSTSRELSVPKSLPSSRAR